MILGIGGCGSISQPRIQAGLSLLVFATVESGGAPSVAVEAASRAWQEGQDRVTNRRPASALPAAAYAAGAQPRKAVKTTRGAILMIPVFGFIRSPPNTRKRKHVRVCAALMGCSRPPAR